MKELEFLKIINNTLSDSTYLGDDCAFLKDLGIYVTQDSLVEDVHFSLKTATPYETGQKSVAVNLSDLASSCAKPEYILISLSLPNNINKNFVEEFYKGVNDIAQKYSVKVVGGDLTKSDKIMISVCAIGKSISNYICSRKNAQKGDLIYTTGVHGSSAMGLKLLNENKKEPLNIIKKHLLPEPRVFEALELVKIFDKDFCMMDSSDGLGDALYKLATNSDVTFEVNYQDIPKDKECIENPDLVFWGGEDFELVFTIDEEKEKFLDKKKFFKIGKVTAKKENIPVIIDFEDRKTVITEEIFNKKIFKHFED